MKKCVIIYNPESGKRKSKKTVETILNVLRENNYNPYLMFTTGVGDATRLVMNIESTDLLLSCGGDGTLNEVVSGNLKRKNKLLMAHLPLGTTNDMGALFGYTRNIRYNLEMLLNGVEKKLDVCLVNNHPFVYICCFGNYVDLAYKTPRVLKKKYGKFGYLMYGMNKFKEDIKPFYIKYTVNGKTYKGEATFIFISNTSRIAGFNNVYRDFKIDDGKFEVAVSNINDKKNLLYAGAQIVTGSMENVEGFSLYKTDGLTVEFEKDFKYSWCIDGEELKENTNKCKFSINRDITMLLPKKNIEKIFENKEKGNKA